jgi:hypothetical protein
LEITNRALIVLLISTVALVGVAVWLSTTTLLSEDEPATALLEPTMIDMGPHVVRMGTRALQPRGDVLVHAADDLPVRLLCDGIKFETMPSDGVATFHTTALNGCQLFLDEDGEPFEPIYPGDEVSCSLDEEAKPAVTECTGSLAETHAATITAWSRAHGVLQVDGKEVGPVPIEGLKLSVGRHTILFEGENVRSDYDLKVGPDEQIELYFHSNARAVQGAPRRPVNTVFQPPAEVPKRTGAAVSP